MIKNSIRNPLGALAQYKSLGTEVSDVQGMYETLNTFWNAVKANFPDAWGLPPTQSRLMHSVGICAMGVLMDKIMSRAIVYRDPKKHIFESVSRIAPQCHWTSGRWDQIGLEWNELQKIGKHQRMLSDLLTHLDFDTKA